MLFGKQILSSVDVSIPEVGLWVARIRLAEDAALVVGAHDVLSIGSLSLFGTVVDGAVHVGFADYLLVGGYGGWRKSVSERAYRADNGVRLRDVVSDLGADVGERVEIGASAERTLGPAWVRPSGLARDAMEDVGVPWHVAPNGTTIIGPRQAGTITAELSVQAYDPVRRTAVVGLDDEQLDAIAPGLTLTADGVEGLRVGHVRVVATPGRTFVEIARHAEREIVEAVLARVEARLRFFGFWPYQVTEQLGTRLTLRPAPLSAGMPAVPQVDVAHGLGGAGDELVKDAVVLLGFRGGNPAAPYVAGILSGTAAKVMLAASASVDVTAPAVRVGEAPRMRVAREGDPVRIDPSLSGSPPVPGGGVLYNPSTQTLQVVPPGTAAAVYFTGTITGGSDVLSSQ